ncbi:Txe/YoeB family addiction module toxin [Pedobacter changchengzhani]|uniref:Putative mRNA interferase YoeB n=1 Tax=Pedobacter changchengzhani TaxID=2529274 RepID=A0A4R5MMI0_9SPHI|nr:Txe/YoeB family addiction module toxin [Pedobacter changchengzhani]TDG36726.1 Txe/YoeB family addiction module toxin [Pedobacter changchengzhani]
MKIEFTPEAWEDFEYWIDNDENTEKKIRELLKEITRTPFQGIGKPEALKHSLKGFWSRRINGEHRLVYQISGTKGTDQKCSVIQCRFHYGDK